MSIAQKIRGLVNETKSDFLAMRDTKKIARKKCKASFRKEYVAESLNVAKGKAREKARRPSFGSRLLSKSKELQKKGKKGKIKQLEWGSTGLYWMNEKPKKPSWLN